MVLVQLESIIQPVGSEFNPMERKPGYQSSLQELKKNQQWLNLALQAGGMGMWYHYPGEDYFFLDRQLCMLLDLEVPEVGYRKLTFQEFLFRVYPEDISRLKRSILSIEKHDKDQNIEFRYINSKGMIKWLSGRGKVLQDEHNQNLLIIGLNFDITEKKQKEMLTIESEARLNTALMEAPVPAMLFDEDGKFLLINKVITKITGYTAAELPNLESWVSKFYHENDRPKIREGISHLFSAKQSIDEGEFRIKIKDGSYRTWHFYTSPLGNTISGKSLLVSMATDVTVQKQIEDALRESEQQLQNIINSIPQIVWKANRRQKKYINKLWFEFTGQPESENGTDRWLDYLHPEDLDKVNLAIEDAMHNNHEYLKEYRIRKKDGTYEWFLSKAKAFMDHDGDYHWFGTTTNIHDQKRNELLIEEKANEFQTLAENIEHHVWIQNKNMIPVYLNSKWKDYTGLSGIDQTGANWRQVFNPDDLEKAELEWRDLMHNHRFYEGEVRIRNHEGIYRWFLVRAVPVFDEKGELIEFIGTNTDIHEQKVLEHLKDEFLNIASHELKTPLTIVKGYAQLIHNNQLVQDNEELIGYSKHLNLAIDKMNRLITDLLELSRIETGNFEQYSFENIEMSTFIQELCGKYLQLYPGFVIQFLGHDDIIINGNPLRMEQVMDNLVSNAVKYSGVNSIEIRLEAVNDHCLVHVIDKGIGIPFDKHNAVFDRFYRIISHSKSSGLGIGLYITREIIKNHGGEIWVENDYNAGAHFIFKIPCMRC